MPSPTSQFCIYEFSRKFDNIQQKNGIWVSGGFEIDKPKAFFRSNYQSGDISAIPAQIRQAVIDGLFEIPNTYPPNPLSNEEFYQKVANKQLDIAHPQPKDIALIARELGDYCVLAVATRQMDDQGFRSKLVGYRYFWLKTSELNPQYPYLVDGIATLLFWWVEQKQPCFDMNPSSYENSPNKNQPYLGERVINKEEIKQEHPPFSKIYQSSSLCLFEPTTDGQLNYFTLHAQAIYLCNIRQKPAWAWNVRKLTKPETFTVVYCADRVSYDQFFSPVLKPIEPSATTGSITTTSGSQISSPHSAQFDPTTLEHSPTQPSFSKPPNPSNQDTVNLTKYLKEVASNTESPSLRSLIECYKDKSPSKHQELWRNCVKPEVLENPEKIQYQADMNNLMLVSVFIWDIDPSKGKSSRKSTDDDKFTEQHKQWAIAYLNKLSESISKYETTYKETVKKLKQNIDKLRKSLSGEDESEGGNGGQPSDLPNFIIKLFMDIASRPYYQWLIIPLLLLLVFFSLVPLEINPLSPIIYKIAGVQFFSEAKKGNNPDIQKLEAAKKFIADKSVTTECKEGGLSANNSECQIYQKIKNQLPEWPQLPEPPLGAVPLPGETVPQKMLAKTRKINSPELVGFLQQSLKVTGAKKVGNLGQFDEKLENAVKEFQAKLKLSEDGQVGENTWKILSDYVQKQQVIAILDYQIESLKQKKNDTEIQEHIQKCKNKDARNPQDYIKPEDFIKCLTPTEENQNGS